MNGFEWILVLVPVVVGGIYLLRRRSRSANPYVSICPNPGNTARGNSVDQKPRAHQDSEVRRLHHDGGCCSR